ncbi:hypothetical protein OQ496_09335 [Acetobacter suratthaniensis]|uniref:ClpX-type ZB domain-containing protein n=1 Tax=Acetobacter suratthaniensis TaxID=1502841 RepID=A0ABS3LMC5_9PROT|nr:ClpX C4-type zinc finger protein [Acetobacter suratthaniensis]MBO1328532.1 hypothetical protein [Acetobacter suratthaniensis]MCX2566661.1 hypothetical protein [Acetobacter suratthaniensis]
MADDSKMLHCDFCGKSNHDVRMLVGGLKANICNECVGLAWQLSKESEIRESVGRMVKRVMFPVLAIRDFFAGKPS